MSSADRLTQKTIWVKFYENRPKGSGDIERTQNSRVNHLTLTCDLDLESRVMCSAHHLSKRNI